jgi:hypothetical protein
MKAALLPDRGVVKVAGEDARKFLNGLLTVDIDKMSPERARFAALLTPQGKIVSDFIIAEAKSAEGSGFFLDVPRALAPLLVQKLKFYKLRAKVIAEDRSETLAVMAVWDGDRATEYGICYADPRLPALGLRCMLPPHQFGVAADELGAERVDPEVYEAHRIVHGVPRGGEDFVYGDTFPHEADMDQLSGIDFDKGCFVGQEVVSRILHRGSARKRVVPVTYDGAAPRPGLEVTAGERALGIMGASSAGHGLAMLRLDRVEEAMTEGTPLKAGGVEIRPVKPDWARFAFPGETKAPE